MEAFRNAASALKERPASWVRTAVRDYLPVVSSHGTPVILNRMQMGAEGPGGPSVALARATHSRCYRLRVESQIEPYLMYVAPFAEGCLSAGLQQARPLEPDPKR